MSKETNKLLEFATRELSCFMVSLKRDMTQTEFVGEPAGIF